MSGLLDIYNKSTSLRIQDTKLIPNKFPTFFDLSHQVQKETKPFPTLKNTLFTDAALNSFDKRVQEFTIPQSFVPVAQGIPLNRWNPKQPYTTPGQRQS